MVVMLIRDCFETIRQVSVPLNLSSVACGSLARQKCQRPVARSLKLPVRHFGGVIRGCRVMKLRGTEASNLCEVVCGWAQASFFYGGRDGPGALVSHRNIPRCTQRPTAVTRAFESLIRISPLLGIGYDKPRRQHITRVYIHQTATLPLDVQFFSLMVSALEYQTTTSLSIYAALS